MQIQSFAFNPFSENTYVLYDDTKECIVVDPGCFDEKEWGILKTFLQENELKPIRLINTHCHIDHIFGNHFIEAEYGLKLEAHELEMEVLRRAGQWATMYQLPFQASPPIEKFIVEGDTVAFGNTTLDVIFTPGHSPGSICLLHKETKAAIVGDVLFYGSIGRTDLPGGDYETLIGSIVTKLLPLEDEWKVYNGHGQPTTIGHERRMNPFLAGI